MPINLTIITIENNNYKKERAEEELPQSGAGKSIHTTEPKFVPNEAVEISLDDELVFKVRMVDCVGYIVRSINFFIKVDFPVLTGPTTPTYMSPWVLSAISLYILKLSKS